MAQGVVVESKTTSQTYRPGEIEQAFQEFINKYGKRYSTTEEYRVAKDAFAENLRTIASLRASGDLTHEVGLNEYADVPRELLHESRKCVPDPKLRRLANSTFTRRVTATPPSSIDWEAAGALAPIRDQKTLLNSCGCCYAISTTVVMESRFKLATGISKVVPFSVQQIVDCSQPYGNEGCDGGSIDSSMHYLDVEGIVKSSSYPFKAKLGTCKTSVTSNPAKQCVKPTQFIYAYVPPEDEDAMMRDVATGPIAVSIYASAPSFEFYKSGIITAKTCGVSTPDHFVTIVGYGTSSTGIP
ncbi:hypothetical protein FOZ61_010483 [Perkinsus olseni]|uniref:Uncharacterized protein n=1 Tax=Perkinsus olseni TaxID=32597 RepID=A0A7J6M939_PEROL|nr:hypothetical protein FOZ61_010483 [Perkinsus olseni]KAF4668082.1 hypothetical protein FOL46_002147 [Perkinsus olseni]